MFYKLAHPKRFFRFINPVRPFIGLLALILLIFGLWSALFDSPPDYQHLDAVRIMYVHVPASWLALSVYVLMASAHITGYIWKHPLADLMAKALAPIGLCFTVLSLVTGSLWGKPMWGAWWVWDARLTSMFVLLLLYISYHMLINSYDDAERGLKIAGIMCIVGVLNIPIIKGSVEWWNTLHQPASISKLSAPSIHTAFRVPLLVMAAGYYLLMIWVALIRLEKELYQRQWQVLKSKQSSVNHLNDCQSESSSCSV